MEVIKIKNDINGISRYVVHFFEFLKKDEKSLKNYKLALKRAKEIGGKVYRGKDFGGGIVFQSQNIEKTIAEIEYITKGV